MGAAGGEPQGAQARGPAAEAVSPLYLVSVLGFMLVIPLVSVGLARLRAPFPLGGLAATWFIFWGVGARLGTAGLKQILEPAFTARQIFQLAGDEAGVVVRELGFANLCLALPALLQLWIPAWRTPTALAGGLYFALAGLMHVAKRPASANEWLALLSDLWMGAIAAWAVLANPP